MSSEPEQHDTQKHDGKDSAELMGIGSKADAGCHVNDVPLIQGQIIALYVGIDLGRQRILIEDMFGIQLHLLKRHEGLIVMQRPSAGVGGPSGLLLYAVAPEALIVSSENLRLSFL